MNASYEELLALVMELTNWAETKGILGDSRVHPGYDEAIIQDTFRRVGLHNATSSLQDRGISDIGMNEVNSSVVIFLEKPLRRADKEALDKVGHGNCAIEFLYAGRQMSGSAPPTSPTVPPYHKHKDNWYSCGSSVSVANEPTAGTIGCLLQDESGSIYALSNNHIFAGNNYCDIGMQILAPGQFDIRANGLDPFTLGHLHRAIPLADGNPEIVDITLNIDAAVIKILTPSSVSSMQRTYYDTPQSSLEMRGNMVVEKVGRTTAKTTGIAVSYFGTPQQIRCNIMRHNSHKYCSFMDFWAVRSQAGAFSVPGDSGSLVTTIDNDGVRHAVGIVFAGDQNISFVIPIHKILNYFSLTIVGGHNV